jgi:hypothetical protein
VFTGREPIRHLPSATQRLGQCANTSGGIDSLSDARRRTLNYRPQPWASIGGKRVLCSRLKSREFLYQKIPLRQTARIAATNAFLGHEDR